VNNAHLAKLGGMNMESSPAGTSPLQQTANSMVKDMHFVGIFAIIYGIIACLTIIGMIFGIPYIFIGIRLREAADEFSKYVESKNEENLQNAFIRQGRSFFIMKVIVIVGLAFLALYIIGLILFFVFNPEIFY
jgi:hypothetical protein